MKVKKARWLKAQAYEKQWWSAVEDDIDLDYYRDYAAILTDELTGLVHLHDNCRILEVGSGAAGIVTFLKGDYRFTVDPLEGYYSQVIQFSRFRNDNVKYLAGKGENLPFPDGLFDLIIMDNVLDHCQEPQKVISEEWRVLKSGGILYFRQGIYHFWGKLIRAILEKFHIDRGHPSTFTTRELTRLFQNSGFESIKYEDTGFFRNWLREIKSGKLKYIIKALLFTTKDTSLFILKKV